MPGQLDRVFRTTVLFASLHLWPSVMRAQYPAAPQFDVASVKQNRSQSTESGISSSSPDRFAATNVPLRFLVLYAYQLRDNQLVGAPDWTWDQSFDVIGTYPAQRPMESEVRIMLQNLLIERFSLKSHHEQREAPAYELVVARADGRLGSHLQTSKADCAAPAAEDAPTPPSPGPPPSGQKPSCTIIATRRFLNGGARTMQELASTLQSLIGRPVVDKTGLTARYDMDMQWAPMDLKTNDTENAPANDGPSLFTALQEQLGLKLVPHKEMFDVLIVDEIKPPTSN